MGITSWDGRARTLVEATGRPCLDLANSVAWPLDRNESSLGDYRDLVTWAHHEGLVDEKEAKRLLRRGADRTRLAKAAHGRALALQAALRDVFSAVATGSAPPEKSLQTLNREISHAMVDVRLVPSAPRFERVWLDPRDDLAWVLGPVARSAADLLVSPELERLKECPGSPGKPCGFFFVDETRNHSRRWCSSSTCGNRTRLHRHYSRLR